MKRSGSTGGSGAAAVGPPTFTVNPGDYRLMEEVGYGAHAVVYRAIFLPRDEVVAVKCLDLDQLNNNIVSTCDTPPSPSCNSSGFRLRSGCCLIWQAKCPFVDLSGFLFLIHLLALGNCGGIVIRVMPYQINSDLALTSC